MEVKGKGAMETVLLLEGELWKGAAAAEVKFEHVEA